MSILQEISESFRRNDIIIKLIYVNTAVFLVMRLMDLAALGGSHATGWGIWWFGMPTGVGVLTKPWTIVTNIFAHYDFFHYIFNMLCLYWFGRLFMQCYADSRRAIVAYVVGGLTGCVAAILLGWIFGGSGGILLGASGAIMSILLAATMSQPDRLVWVTFFGEVKMKYIALVYVALSLIMLIGLVNVGGNLAHLGGALAGYVLARHWDGRPAAPRRKNRNMKVSFGGNTNPDWEYNKRRADNDREVDRILDKISARGYNSLTEEEKKTLFDQSKR